MFPDMRDALQGFNGKHMQFTLVTKTVTDFEIVETNNSVNWFSGVAQPLSPQRIALKPEGQRTWKWWTIWTTERLVLDAKIKDCDQKQYRVMAISDWSQAGYRMYELTETFK